MKIQIWSALNWDVPLNRQRDKVVFPLSQYYKFEYGLWKEKVISISVGQKIYILKKKSKKAAFRKLNLKITEPLPGMTNTNLRATTRLSTKDQLANN